MRDRQAASVGLRRDEWRVLFALFEFGPMPSIRLMDVTFMDRAAVSRTVARLEEASLVFRVSDASDGRVAIVKPTESGYVKGQQISDAMREQECALMSVLSDEEYEEWMRITDKLDARLDELIAKVLAG